MDFFIDKVYMRGERRLRHCAHNTSGMSLFSLKAQLSSKDGITN